jgi:hypothetical protein
VWRIILTSVSCLDSPYFTTLCHKRCDFRGGGGGGGVSEQKCVLNFSTIFETFFILSRIKRDTIINVRSSSRECSVFLTDFNQT